MNCNNFCDNHKCSRCGECCGIAIPITKKEEKRIRIYIQENDVKPENLFENNNFYAKCCFYDRKNKCCKIYPARPGICRSFKCDRKENELEKEKEEKHMRAYWNHVDSNGNLKNLTTFDLLFFNNPRPLLELLFRVVVPGAMDEKKYERVKNILINCGQEELANSIKPIYKEE